MGLDMYLYRYTHVKYSQARIAISASDSSLDHIDANRLHSIVEEIGYWRKFYALHSYIVETFADGVDDCQWIFIDWEGVDELVELLKQVRDNHDLAPKLLPGGRGGYPEEYDTYYFEDVDKAIKIFEFAAESPDDCSIYYRGSW